MKIGKKLKRLGIEETKEFTIEEKNIVANNVTDSLIMAFPVLKIEQENILNKIQNANMFYAKIDENLPKINYIYENHKIYFDESIDINKLTDSMIHEIIHYIQDIRKKRDKLDKIGLCNFNELSLHGLGINEGAVQYISAKALNSFEQTVNKDGILFRTISPNYYPILTNLTEQIISLIGEDELVKAIILNNKDFENTFFNTFEESAQNIINLFDEIINYYVKNNDAKLIKFNPNKKENSIEEIKSLYIETQDTIMRTYFDKKLKNITTEEEVEALSKKIEKYLDLTGKIEINSNYYNNCENYKSTLINKLDKKLIKIHEQKSKMALAVVYGGRLTRLFNKIKSLFKSNA